MDHPFSEEDIIRYIRGEMLVPEQLAIEKELNLNEQLVTDVEELKNALIAIDRAGENNLKERFKKLEKRNKLKKWLSITFGVFVILLIGLIIKKIMSDDKQNIQDQIYATHFEKYREPVTIRKTNTLELDFNMAAKAYISEDYSTALELFNKGCNNNNLESCFYASLSAIYDGRATPNNASNLLKNNEAYSAILLWHEALQKIKKGDLIEAENVLIELISNGSFKKEEAIKIVDELSNQNK